MLSAKWQPICSGINVFSPRQDCIISALAMEIYFQGKKINFEALFIYAWKKKKSTYSPFFFSVLIVWALDFSSVILLTHCGLIAPGAVMEVDQENGLLPFWCQAITWTNFQVNNSEYILVKSESK